MLLVKFPNMVSLPEPPIAFSITVPAARTRLPTAPPIFEIEGSVSVLEVTARLMTWFAVKPLKSSVSIPPPSIIVDAVMPA